MSRGAQVVLLCPNPIGERMRGLGIRYTEVSRALRDAGLRVTLAAPGIDGASEPGLQVRRWPPDGVRALRAMVSGADAVLAPPCAPHVMRELRRCGARVAIDLYDPVALEVLEHHAGRSAALRATHATTASDQLTDALRSGDYFVCASERQRDLWIGALLARGRVTARVYDRDPLLRSLIDVVAFGVPAAPPAAPQADPIRDRFPEIGVEERVLLWNGGLWRWLDAPTAIRAVARVRARGLTVRLVFMGASAAGGAGAALAEARAAVAREELGDAVLFNDVWVPYAARAGWLQAADAVISTHRDHLETRYAFRTRLLDCLWAGVPAVVTGGDELAARIDAEDLGVVARPGDDEGLADGIERVLRRDRKEYAPALRAAARDYEWPRVIAPLRAFLAGEIDVEGRRSLAVTGAKALPLRRGLQRLTRLARMARRG
jgi:glycosyltransferase involved in cell wall biosynthesis